MNPQVESERIRDARLIRGALHYVHQEAARARVTTAIVRLIERKITLAGLDVVLREVMPLVPGPHLGALKKAVAGVIERTSGEAAESAKKTTKRASSKKSDDGGTLGLFAAQEPEPEPRIVPPSGELVFVDTETTGLKAGAHQVIEIGAMTSDGAEFVACVKLWPGAEVDAGAMRINGINLRGQQWRDEAIALDEALRAFVRWLPTGAVLVAHNAAFDRRMLEGDAARVGVEWPSVEWFCTKLWADDLRKRGLLTIENSKLHTLCERFGVPNEGEHRALADVVRMARVYEGMAELEEAREAA